MPAYEILEKTTIQRNLITGTVKTETAYEILGKGISGYVFKDKDVALGVMDALNSQLGLPPEGYADL